MSFFLKKLASYALLPPGLFILGFLLLALFTRGLVRRSALLFGLLLYLLSIEPFKDLLFYPLEAPYRKPVYGNAQAIVVLGGGVYNNGYLKPSSYRRLVTAFLLHRETGLPVILSGGAPFTKLPEAERMRQLLKAFGVDESLLYADVKSRDTYENALFVRRLCEKLGCRRVYLVTSAFHMGRAERLFRKAGLEVLPYPTDFRLEGRYNLFSLFPKYSVLYDSSAALREHLARLFYKLKGHL
ncbi:MAG: YdcF family protein [Aquificae bacterium]|nr:YdcF family protein [Aquificota bacterium]